MACFPDVWAPTGLSYFTAVTSAFLLFAITSGNALIILAVVKDPLKKLRTPFNFFLVNLAVSDFLVGAITMPISVKQHLQETSGWKSPDHEIVMHLSYFISATASVFNLAALSVDRFCAIRWPIRYRRGINLRRYGMVSALIWMTSIAVSMVYFETGYIESLMIFIHVAVFLTFSILVLTYIQVDRAFKAQIKVLLGTKRASQAFQYNQLHAIRLEKKVTRAFLWILGFFVASYTPAVVMIYVLQFCTKCDCKFRHSLRDLTFLLVSANSGVNPFICAIRLKEFRRSILSLFRCKTGITEDCAYVLPSRDRSSVKSTSTTVDQRSTQESTGDTK